jgi:putative transposase
MSVDPFSFVLVTVAGWMSRHQQEVISYLIEENRVLREQVGDRRLKFNDDQRRRLATKAKKLGRKMLRQVATIVAPETLLTWHRKLIAENYARSPGRPPGRHSTRKEIAALAVRMAEENRSWGYRRIQGALANLGHDLAHNTIRNILKRHGIEPSPERARKTTWKEFLQRHWHQIVATDFFTISPLNRLGLAGLVILGFMKLSTRRVDISGTARGTDGLSMTRIARKVTDDMESVGKGKRDHIAEQRPRTRCHCHLDGNESSVGDRLTVPFAASNQKASRVKRRQRRDRLLNDYQCEAA